MKISRKLKTFLILRVIEIKYNIRLSELTGIKTGNGMMLLNLIIFQKLLRIFTPIIPINRNLKQELESEKRIDLLERPYI